MINPKDYPVSLTEVYRAKRIVGQCLKPTQLIHYPALSSVTGVQVYVKHENHNPTGSFKIRGGINLMHHLKAAGIEGVITHSTGNHGLSVATSAAWAGMNAVVVVPQHNNPVKNLAIRATGAELVEAGATLEDCAAVVDDLCLQRGLYSAHPANEPHLINGVGTEFLEIVEDLPDIDVMIVPIGAGSEAAAAGTVLKALTPRCEIIAVQAERSPAACLSWREGQVMTAANETFAGGFATGSAYALPFDIYRHVLTDFVLLSEDEIYQGINAALHHTHQLAEGAGAASLMALIKLRDRLQGKKVVVQMSGCNASPEEIATAVKLADYPF